MQLVLQLGLREPVRPARSGASRLRLAPDTLRPAPIGLSIYGYKSSCATNNILSNKSWRETERAENREQVLVVQREFRCRRLFNRPNRFAPLENN